jgi:glutamate/tyrosine decarboxylase-like PLP-dependent enzyme
MSTSELLEILCNFLKKRSDDCIPVVNFYPPETVAKKLNDAKTPSEAISTILNLSVKTNNPYFLNQLFGTPDDIGIIADWLTTLLNTSAYTYDVAPVFTMMEKEIVSEFSKIVYKKETDGTFFPGASSANMTALSMTVSKFNKQWPQSRHWCAIVSEHSHYSFDKAFMMMGSPPNGRIIKIKCTSSGQMDIIDLHKILLDITEQMITPVFIAVTLGTTVFGATDDLYQITELIKKINSDIWIHVDAAWGGPMLLLSPDETDRLTNTSRLQEAVLNADSVVWNLHKMMGVPLQCSLMLTKNNDTLKNSFSMDTPYLFQNDKQHGDMDLGNKTFQCGRKCDSCKAWFCWKFIGRSEYEKRIHYFHKLTMYTQDIIEKYPRLVLVNEPFFNNICFWILPPDMSKDITNPRDFAFQSEQWNKIHNYHCEMRQLAQNSGFCLINYQSIDKLPNFFRLVFTNPNTQFKHIHRMFEFFLSV